MELDERAKKYYEDLKEAMREEMDGDPYEDEDIDEIDENDPRLDPQSPFYDVFLWQRFERRKQEKEEEEFEDLDEEPIETRPYFRTAREFRAWRNEQRRRREAEVMEWRRRRSLK